jgi:flagella basal body P-ring formation protein FlgA
MKETQLVYNHFNIDFDPYLFPIFKIISNKNGVINTDLQNALQYTQPAITQAINKLNSKGLIIYKVDKCDKRKKIIHLSEKGKNTLKIECISQTPWRIFMTAQVQLFSHALVFNQPFNKGHLLKESDITLKKIELTGHRSAYLSESKHAINHVLKRRVRRGDLVSVNILSTPTLIKKGDNITIIAKNKGFQISMKGIALMAGGKNDKIKVKNIKTKKIIQGIISDSQTVRVSI